MEETADKEKFDAIEAEKRELRLLIDNGISFVVNYKEKRKVSLPKWKHLRFIKKTKTVLEDKQVELVIKEPTAYTLDRMSAEYIELVIDENKVRENPRQEARKLFIEHNKRMARIVAIAVLGNQWEDKKELERLTDFLHRWIKNSQLHDLVQAIDLTNNLADFINSMRLMSGARTTMPNRVEKPEA